MTQRREKKLLDRVRDAIRTKHYSIRTEETYVNWIKRFILFHHKRHLLEMGAAEIEEYLTYLAVERNVVVSTRNQSFSTLFFLRSDPGATEPMPSRRYTCQQAFIQSVSFG